MFHLQIPNVKLNLKMSFKQLLNHSKQYPQGGLIILSNHVEALESNLKRRENFQKDFSAAIEPFLKFTSWFFGKGNQETDQQDEHNQVGKLLNENKRLSFEICEKNRIITSKNLEIEKLLVCRREVY